MSSALARHDEIVHAAATGHHGQVVKSTGDGALAVFAAAEDAITAAVGALLALSSEPWPEGNELRVRMAIHSGP